MMRICLFAVLLGILAPSRAYAIIAWDGASGLLPDAAAIPPDQRFDVVGTFASISGNMLSVDDTSNVLAVVISKTDIAPIQPSDNWYFETIFRVNTIAGAIAGSTGVVDESRFARLHFSDDQVGFTDGGLTFLTQAVVDFDTTDEFHTYRVEKIGNLVTLFIDQSSMFTIDYDQLAAIGGSQLDLLQSSNEGISNFDVARYEFDFIRNSEPSVVPEPVTTTLVLLAVVALLSCPRRYSIN